jgi:Zn finger protein HypA/HybF involved in hydrogenase expression
MENQSLMRTLTEHTAQPDPRPHAFHRARCECRGCGAHTMADVGYKVAGQCPNCGSYDLAEVELRP